MTPKNGDFFEKIDFYSSLKEKNISDKKYEDVKKLFKLLRLETLGNMNKIYNIQDTLILCEIFEQRSMLLEKLFKFNPRKCNSASSFSGCVQRKRANVILCFLQTLKKIKVFEKTLIGGYKLFLKDKVNERAL